MPEHVTRQARKPGALPGAVDHLIQAGCGQRHPAARVLQDHEARVGQHLRWALRLQVLAQRLEEPAGDRHDPLPAALAREHEQSPLAGINVLKPQSQHLAAPQPRQQHRQHDRPIPLRAQRAQQRVDLHRREHPRQRLRPSDQAHPASSALSWAPTGEATRYRVALDTRVATNDQIVKQPGDARQPSGDRPRRQTRLTVLDPHHVPMPRCALLGRNANRSADLTSAGSLPTTSKNTFKSYAVASHVFLAPRAPTNSKYASMSGSPSVIAQSSAPFITRCILGTKLTTVLLPHRRQDGAERSSPHRTARTR